MRKLFTYVLLLFCANSSGQHYLSTCYTAKDGLSHYEVRCMVTDREGFLWVATASGLNRFDGNSFETFYNNPADTGTIADNHIQKLFIDLHDQLWIGTNAGISLYHRRTRSFSNYYVDTSLLPQQGTTYEAICNDRDDNIWIGTKNGLLVFDPLKKKFMSTGWRAFADKVAPSNANRLRVVIKSIFKKSDIELWVLSSLGLFSVNTQTKKFEYYVNEKIDDYYGCKIIGTDSDKNLWLSAYTSGLYVFNPKSNAWDSYSIPGNNFISSFSEQSVVPYAPDTLMYCARDGIRLFSQKTRKPLVQLNIFDSNANGTSNKITSQSVYRNNSLLWLATNNGLLKITAYKNPFEFISLGDDHYFVDRLYTLVSNEAMLFSATDNNTGDAKAYVKTMAEGIRPLLDAQGRNIEVSGQWLAPCNDTICYLNDDEHLYRYNTATHKATSIPLVDYEQLKHTFAFKKIVTDNSNNLWVRSPELGIFKYDWAAGTFDYARDLPQKTGKETNALYYDSLTNCIWYAQEFDGINVYNLSTSTARHYNLTRPPSQRSAAIISIAGDGKGKIWLSDLQAGLIEYDEATRSFKRFTESNGLPTNDIAGLVYDNANGLWISTVRGLCKYFVTEGKFLTFPVIPPFSFTFNKSLTADADGNIYIADGHGYYIGNSASIKATRRDGTIYLRDAMLFGAHLAIDSVYQFSHSQNNVQLLFGLLSFATGNDIKMSYSLNGGDWITADLHSYISFANLSPGTYTLRVKTNNEEVTHLQLRFNIEKALWQTSGFIAVCFFVVLITAAYLISARMAQFKRQTVLRQKIMESEMSALRSQMNPHFIFNTLNSINSYIIENRKDEASDYLTDFSRLIRIILEYSQKKTVSLGEELNALKLYLELECKRLNNAFDYTISISNLVDVNTVSVPPLIMQPYVENAIWHGLHGKKGGGHISVTVSKYEQGILLLIEDDGVGRKRSTESARLKEGSSFGTAATMQRILLNDARSKVQTEDLYTAGGAAAGTRVKVFLYQNNARIDEAN